MEEFPTCHICHSERRRPLYLHRGVLALGCEVCGILEAFPAPTPEDVSSYYADSSGWDDRTSFRDPNELEQWLGRRRRAYRDEVELLLEAIGPSTAANPKRVLDFGCGRGVVLDVFAEEGWETMGVEPAPSSAAIAAERHEIVAEIPEEGQFDLVVAIHVLEHLLDPRAAIAALANVTSPEGHIYATVPNVDRLPEHGLFRYLLNRHHLFAFSSSGIRAALTAGGYGNVEILRDGPWEHVRDAARSMRSLAQRTPGPHLEVDEAPLAVSLRSLREFGTTPAAEEVIGKGRG